LTVFGARHENAEIIIKLSNFYQWHLVGTSFFFLLRFGLGKGDIFPSAEIVYVCVPKNFKLSNFDEVSIFAFRTQLKT
jgi:hypothetical protein